MGAHNKATRFRRTRSWATVAILIGSAVVWAAGPSQAAPACPIPGNFEIDGDMTQHTCTPPGDDWDTPGIGVQSTSQGGTYKTSSKDNSDPTGWTSGGSTPDKTNFDQEYATSRVVNGHFFVYVAWERTDTSGTQGYAIEIDNAGTRVATDGTPQPDRSHGGTVVYLSSQGSGAPTLDDACSFDTQANYPGTCTSSNANVIFAINTTSIADPLRGTTQAAGSFFEVALDITNLSGIAPSCPGPSAASVYLRSITGQTSNGNLKGYMAPLSVAPDSTCVAPMIVTTATPGNSMIDGLAVTTPGSSQRDTATVGTDQVPGVGTVTFFLCSPAEVTTNGGDCSANGTQVGVPKPLGGDGIALSDAVTGATTPSDTALGKYCWRAEFAPSADDHNYLPGTHTNSTTECFTVAAASPSIATQAHSTTTSGAATGSIGFTLLSDTATLSNVYPNATLDGQTVAFSLYGPLASAPGPNDCSGTPIFTSSAPLGQPAGSWQATTPQFTPTAADGPGFYTWVASYAGDQINGAVSGSCGDANETTQLVGPTLTLTKGTPHSTITAGDDVVYDVNLGNVGAGTASGVVVTDVLPILAGGGTWTLSATGGYNCTLAAGTGPNVGHQVLTCTVGNLNPSTLTQIAEVTATTTAADCGTISNSAALAADPNISQTAGPVNVTVLCPQLAITKVADAASVNVGSPIGFTITATNTGQGTATGVLLDDPLPTGPGISWAITGATGPLSCSIAANDLTCTGSLASGASESVHVTSSTQWTNTGGTVVNSCLGGANGDGVYDNTAQVSATNSTNSPTDEATTQVLCPDLSVTKTADAAAVNAGTSIGFTITATNSGAGDATGTLISDPLPPGVTWSIDGAGTTGPLTCGISSGTLTCTGTLGAKAVETVHITAPTTFADCGKYDNTATLTATNTPQAPQGSDSTQVLCASLDVQKTADAVSVSVGSDIGFTVTVTNTGAGAAVGTHVSDPLPAGPGINWTISAQTGPLTCSISAPPQVLTCAGDMAPAGDASHSDVETVHVTSSTVWNSDHNSCGDYDNTATLHWDNGPATPMSSNQATETVLCPALNITKTADAASVDAGADIGFTVEVTNAGLGTATGVTLTDPLPDGAGVNWSLDSVTGIAAADCAIDGVAAAQVLDCTFGDLAPQADITIHLVSASTPASCGDYDNTATLHATNEPGLQAKATTTVLCANLTISKTADARVVDVGQSIGFTVTVSNTGDGTAHGVDVTDPLPTGPGISWSIDFVNGPLSCAITAGELECTGTLASQASEMVHITSATHFTTDVNSCGTYDNTATVSATNVIGAPSDEASEDVRCPDLSLTKVADHAVVNAGSPIGFTITAANSGDGTAAVTEINDPLPHGTGVDWTIESQSGTACDITGAAPTQTLHCNFGSFTPNSSYTVHIVSDTSFASCADYMNTATLSADNSPSVPASDTTTVRCADLAIAKTHDAASVSVGDDIGFTVTITNTGNGDALGVDVEDPLPSGQGVSWSIADATGPLSCSIGGSPPSQTLACTGDLAAAGNADHHDVQTVHVTSSTVWNADLNSCGTYDNTASVTWGNGPADPRTAEASEDVLCPSLAITKAPDQAVVSAGDSIGFTVHVTNGGPGTAADVTLSDPLPAGADVDWTIESVTGASDPSDCMINGAIGGQELDCSFGAVPPAADIRVHIVSTTTGNSCAEYDNDATLHADNEPGLDDAASLLVNCPDVSLVKTPDKQTPVNAGEPIGFTITASNSDAPDTGTAHDVTIDDPLPGGAGVDWSIESGPANCSISGTAPTQTLTCTPVSLAPGAQESVHVVSGTEFASCGTYDNTATLTLSNAAPPQGAPLAAAVDPAALTASASMTVDCPALTLIKTADAPSVIAGHRIGFVIGIQNAGPGVATGAMLNDPLPSGGGVSWTLDASGTTAPGCTVQNVVGAQTLVCDLGDVPSGASLSVHLVSATTIDSCATYHNVATLNASNAPTLTADASTKVTECAAVLPTPTSEPPVAVTGAGPVQSELGIVALLFGAGGGLLLLGRRRRKAGRHA